MDLADGSIVELEGASAVLETCLARVALEMDPTSSGADLGILLDRTAQMYGCMRAAEQRGILRSPLNVLAHACGPQWQLTQGAGALDGTSCGCMVLVVDVALRLLGRYSEQADLQLEHDTEIVRDAILRAGISFMRAGHAVGITHSKMVFNSLSAIRGRSDVIKALLVVVRTPLGLALAQEAAFLRMVPITLPFYRHVMKLLAFLVPQPAIARALAALSDGEFSAASVRNALAPGRGGVGVSNKHVGTMLENVFSRISDPAVQAILERVVGRIPAGDLSSRNDRARGGAGVRVYADSAPRTPAVVQVSSQSSRVAEIEDSEEVDGDMLMMQDWREAARKRRQFFLMMWGFDRFADVDEGVFLPMSPPRKRTKANWEVVVKLGLDKGWTDAASWPRLRMAAAPSSGVGASVQVTASRCSHTHPVLATANTAVEARGTRGAPAQVDRADKLSAAEEIEQQPEGSIGLGPSAPELRGLAQAIGGEVSLD